MAGEYSEEDLHLLRILRDKRDLDGTAYFEFHPRNLKSEHSCWNEGSIYLADAGFDFFCECFHKANREFDYFEFCKFNGEEISRLNHEISAFLSEVEGSDERKVIFSKFAGLFGKDMWNQVSEKKIRDELVATGKALIHFFNGAEKESGILWVLGM